MKELAVHDSHTVLGAHFSQVHGQEVVSCYDNALVEYECLSKAVGILDLSFRGRICLTGSDRVRFLHGQVTNDIKSLQTGQGCYAALTTVKGKITSDLN